MSIIFCGDIAQPYNVMVDYESIKPIFSNNIGIANLEGSILTCESQTSLDRWSDKFSLYSSPKVIDVLHDLHIKAVSLCNNHILDYHHDVNATVELLSRNGIASFGLKNHDVIELELNGKPLFIITFSTCSNDHALNLFSPRKVVEEVKRLKQSFPSSYVVIYPHWGCELFYYPEPADRTLAHKLIDVGADLVVGHHPHIVQAIEEYKGKTIVYSLGNFILPQTFYGKKKLTYIDSRVSQELILEWNGKEIKLYPLQFDVKTNRLTINKDSDAERHYQYFSDTYSWSKYTLQYIKKSRLKNVLRTRYFATGVHERLYHFRNRFIRLFRRILMYMRLHKPYNY